MPGTAERLVHSPDPRSSDAPLSASSAECSLPKARTLNHWEVTGSALGIVITCRGHDKARTVGAAVETFQALAAGRAGRFSIIADLREMTGYESESRVAWQQTFRQFRTRIDCLVLVGARSALIRMGAAAVGAVAGIPVRFVASWDEVADAVRGE